MPLTSAFMCREVRRRAGWALVASLRVASCDKRRATQRHRGWALRQFSDGLQRSRGCRGSDGGRRSRSLGSSKPQGRASPRCPLLLLLTSLRCRMASGAVVECRILLARKARTRPSCARCALGTITVRSCQEEGEQLTRWERSHGRSGSCWRTAGLYNFVGSCGRLAAPTVGRLAARRTMDPCRLSSRPTGGFIEHAPVGFGHECRAMPLRCMGHDRAFSSPIALPRSCHAEAPDGQWHGVVCGLRR